MRPGVRLGIDVGSVRIGVACCDRDGLIATPLETVSRGQGDLDRISLLALDGGAVEVVVGLPKSMSGAEGSAAALARTFARELASVVTVPVRLVDERLTTVSATRDLRAAGVSSRAGRGVVDQAAAVIILQGALDSERATGRLPGEAVPASPDLDQRSDEQGDQ